MAKKKNPYWWTSLSDKELLELRFCDLNLSLRKSRMTPLIKSLYQELADKDLRFKPHFWIADEWYATDGVPGIAVPFYLVHDRLIALQNKILGNAEGQDPFECMKLLRHEAGHAMDNAFHLRKSRRRQKLFGLSSVPYPQGYRPQMHYKNFVTHLNPWYAQAHPDEDWSESFAIWLCPKSSWKKKYKVWPKALEKIRFVDQMMKDIKGQKPKVVRRERPGLITRSRKKLKTFYAEQKSYLELSEDFNLTPAFAHLFSTSSKFQKHKLATVFLKKERNDVLSSIAHWTGQDVYTIGQMWDELMEHLSEKKFRLIHSEKQTRLEIVAMLTAYNMNMIHSGSHAIKM